MKTKKTPIYLNSNSRIQNAEIAELDNIPVYDGFPDYDKDAREIGKTISIEQKEDGIYADMVITDPDFIHKIKMQPCVGMELDEEIDQVKFTHIALLPYGSNVDSNIPPIEFIQES